MLTWSVSRISPRSLCIATLSSSPQSFTDAALRGKTALTKLSVGGHVRIHGTPFASMTSLTALNIRDNVIDSAPLGLVAGQLRKFKFGRSPVAEDTLCAMTNLHSLALQEVGHHYGTVVRRLTSLQSLDLSNSTRQVIFTPTYWNDLMQLTRLNVTECDWFAHHDFRNTPRLQTVVCSKASRLFENTTMAGINIVKT